MPKGKITRSSRRTSEKTSIATWFSLRHRSLARLVRRTRPTRSLGAALRTLPDSSNAEAQKLEKEAINAMGPDQLAAIDSLKRAVEADPKFTRGWVTLGSLYMALSQTNAGLDAFHKAIDSDPNQPVSYEMLATALMSQRKVEDAIQVWQALLKVAPEDRNAITNLGELFYVDKRYAEAVQILETEVRLNPSAVGPLTRLGIAYLKSGEADKGYATIQQLLKIDSGPMSLNNIAYELADANIKLTEALDYAEKAVRTEEEASDEIRLSSLTDENLHSTQRIASYWDTLGWVHFRLGHLDEAEKFLRASWMLSHKGIAADHLGQLYEAKQRRTDAGCMPSARYPGKQRKRPGEEIPHRSSSFVPFGARG